MNKNRFTADVRGVKHNKAWMNITEYGIGWASYGTQSVADTKLFIKALQSGIRQANKMNKAIKAGKCQGYGGCSGRGHDWRCETETKQNGN